MLAADVTSVLNQRVISPFQLNHIKTKNEAFSLIEACRVAVQCIAIFPMFVFPGSQMCTNRGVLEWQELFSNQGPNLDTGTGKYQES